MNQYLKAHGCRCTVETEKPEEKGRSYRYTDPDGIPGDIECLIVLGGDGTLLQAARDVAGRQIPLLGINLGTLGYLAEIDRQNIIPALDRLMGDGICDRAQDDALRQGLPGGSSCWRRILP